MGTFNKLATGEGGFGIPEVVSECETVDVSETDIGEDIVVVI